MIFMGWKFTKSNNLKLSSLGYVKKKKINALDYNIGERDSQLFTLKKSRDNRTHTKQLFTAHSPNSSLV